MNLRRILKLLLGSFLGQGVTVVTQLLVPPLFLRFYGLEVFGEWTLLSASISYLSTLNYGIQTYSNNEMTIRYQGGDVAGAKALQASAFRLLLALLTAFAVLGLSVFFLPIQHMLKLRHETTAVAALTLYLLIVQIAFNMMYSLLVNSYMVVGLLHRGNYLASAQRLFMVLALAVALATRQTLPVLAAIQLGSLVLFFFIALVDLRRIAPILIPSLRYGSWREVRAILKPSSHFGLIAIAGFLTWQAPVLLIQEVLGPATVGLFQLVRVVFQMSRQILMIASSTIGQDITLLVGRNDWKQLRRLYDLSERIVLFLIPVVSIGTLLLCPLLFALWLHKPGLYNPQLCLLMAIVSAVLGIKEHKTQFQSSSNKHEELSVVILCGYAAMLALSLLTMKLFGLPGFILTWLAWEIVQTRFVLGLNDRMFPAEHRISMQPMLRLTVFVAIAFALSAYPAYHEAAWGLGWTVLSAVLATTLLGAAAYFVFDVDEIRLLLQARLRARFATARSAKIAAS
jgi:O-antigen/teichoic acid export membrane protein